MYVSENAWKVLFFNITSNLPETAEPDRCGVMQKELQNITDFRIPYLISSLLTIKISHAWCHSSTAGIGNGK
jgi:hypothetical protein